MTSTSHATSFPKLDSKDESSHLTPITITVPDALRLSGIGRTKLYELIAEGRLKSTLIGKRRLVVYSSLERLFAGNKEA